VATIEGDDVAAALIGYARAHNLTTVVLGASPPRWLRPSLVDAVTRAARDLTVHVVPPRGPSPRPQPEPSQTGRTARDLAVGVLVVAAATGVAWLGRDVLPETDLLMIYLGALVVAAFRLPRGVSFATALLAVSAFNFFFTEPRFTLYVDERRYLLTFTVLGGIGFLVSHLAARVRERAAAAARREREARALYRLGRDLAGADDVVAVATVAVEHLGRWLDGDVVVLLPDGDHLERVAGAAAPTDDERAVARYAFEHAAPSGRGTDTLPSAATTWLPIGQGGRVYGVVGLRGARGLAERRTLVDAILDHVGLSLAREAFAARSAAATREVDAERTRTSLLASVSHDLRTPLAAITGAATTLLDSPVDAAARGRLLGEIVDESLRLERLLQNLLQMTRLQEGASPDFDWCVAQEIVATAVERVRREAGPRVIRVEAPDDPVWTRCDALLVEQATVNLLENALRHAPGATPIDVRVVSGDPVRIEVLDRGPGVEPERAERVFDRFERGPRSTGGAGLGLAIVRAVARVHGGDATVSRRDGGGAAFALTLPGGAPEVPP
jgi:two-component system sensor histidine kinase KdpD